MGDVRLGFYLCRGGGQRGGRGVKEGRDLRFAVGADGEGDSGGGGEESRSDPCEEAAAAAINAAPTRLFCHSVSSMRGRRSHGYGDAQTRRWILGLEEWKREMRGRGGRCWGVVWVGIVGGMGDMGIRGEMWDIRYKIGGLESGL